MSLSLHTAIAPVLRLATQMIEWNEKEIISDVLVQKTLSDATDKYLGKYGHTLAESLTAENINYRKTEQGQTVFEQFIIKVLQIGMSIGSEMTERDKVEHLKRDLAHAERMQAILTRENAELVLNQMPNNDLANEVKQLRTEISGLKGQISKLNRIKEHATNFFRYVNNELKA